MRLALVLLAVSVVAARGQYVTDQYTATTNEVNDGLNQTKPLTSYNFANSKWANTNTSSVNTTTKPYLGFVAGQGRVPNALVSGNKVFGSRQAFIAAVDITNIQVVLPNFYGNNGDETGSGGAATVAASIMYPSGTFNQLLFSGQQYSNVPSGTMAFSDLKSQPRIPQGAMFWVCAYYTNGAGIIYQPSSSPYDYGELGATGSDKTTNGASMSQLNAANPMYGAIAVLGNTTKESVLILGDSRDYGYADVNSFGNAGGSQRFPSPYLGIDRVICPYYGSCNLAVNSAQFFNYTTHSNLMYFTNFATVVWCELGINGIGATTFGLATNFYSRFSVPVYQETLSPETSSSDGWMTLANQTDTGGPYRTNFNTLVRSHLVPYLAGYYDTAAIATESSLNSGKWQVLQSTNFPGLTTACLTNFTADGLHGPYYGILAASSGDPLRQYAPLSIITGDTRQGNFTGSYAGNGSNLNNLNASAISSGTVPTANLPGSVVTNNQQFVTVSNLNVGTVTATNISGNGSGLTNTASSSLQQFAQIGAFYIGTNGTSLVVSNQYGIMFNLTTNGSGSFVGLTNTDNVSLGGNGKTLRIIGSATMAGNFVPDTNPRTWGGSVVNFLASTLTLSTTNAGPSNVTIGVTAVDLWFPVTNSGSVYFMPVWKNH